MLTWNMLCGAAWICVLRLSHIRVRINSFPLHREHPQSQLRIQMDYKRRGQACPFPFSWERGTTLLPSAIIRNAGLCTLTCTTRVLRPADLHWATVPKSLVFPFACSLWVASLSRHNLLHSPASIPTSTCLYLYVLLFWRLPVRQTLTW